jgi:hypothetical protein
MRNPEHQYRLALIVNPAHHAVRSDPVPPKSCLVSCQRFAGIPWVIVSRDAPVEELHDSLLSGPVQLL